VEFGAKAIAQLTALPAAVAAVTAAAAAAAAVYRSVRGGLTRSDLGYISRPRNVLC